MNQTIKPESPVSLMVLAAVIVGTFTLFTTFEPSFQQIEVNAAEIENIKEVQKDYLEHMIKVTNSLSRIEGRLEPRLIQGGPR